MLVVKKGSKTYQYSGTVQDMFNEYYIPDSCVCTLDIQEYTDCEATILDFVSLPTLDLT